MRFYEKKKARFVTKEMLLGLDKQKSPQSIVSKNDLNNNGIKTDLEKEETTRETLKDADERLIGWKTKVK